ncbi:MAG: nucleotidyltransferase protein [Nocardia sp.]|uniref:nucleotidyltransferase domain-containing protein n=1 Tax=Nocardia sp. TaxID=1821 RepID=UPI00260F51A4|nr:nucleotidyltransferase domain-containing protein [Nocardia sp.]MCU1640739.1 nucleotidyltransferase protein [Nocardia sp.]
MSGLSNRLPSALTLHDLMPPDPKAVLLVGSHARGWAHESSDVDVIVVVEQPISDPRAGGIEVALQPERVQAVATYADDARLEVKYWLTGQIDQVLDKVSWDAFEHSDTLNDQLDEQSKIMLDHMMTCVPLAGEPWVQALRERIRDSAFRAFLVDAALNRCDDKAESALGMLASGDPHSAVLAAREAFGFAIDALLLGQGEFNLHRKWRARRFRELAPGSMSYAQYWEWETMRGLDPEAPERWVEAIVRLCKNVWLDIDV